MQEFFSPTERNYSLHYFLFLIVDYVFYKEDTVLMQAVGKNNSECVSEGEQLLMLSWRFVALDHGFQRA